MTTPVKLSFCVILILLGGCEYFPGPPQQVSHAGRPAPGIPRADCCYFYPEYPNVSFDNPYHGRGMSIIR